MLGGRSHCGIVLRPSERCGQSLRGQVMTSFEETDREGRKGGSRGRGNGQRNRVLEGKKSEGFVAVDSGEVPSRGNHASYRGACPSVRKIGDKQHKVVLLEEHLVFRGR